MCLEYMIELCLQNESEWGKLRKQKNQSEERVNIAQTKERSKGRITGYNHESWCEVWHPASGTTEDLFLSWRNRIAVHSLGEGNAPCQGMGGCFSVRTFGRCGVGVTVYCSRNLGRLVGLVSKHCRIRICQPATLQQKYPGEIIHNVHDSQTIKITNLFLP